MAGIKIHQYPLERTSIGDEDYYDIDYYTGSGYQSAKIKGSTLKNVLGANYIDISTFISGYNLTNVDAGKLITNSNANVRTLVITSGLALPNNMVSVKGRIAIQPETGVNITLPNGSTITEPTQFTCEADEVYILHKSAFTGDNYILVSLKKSENIGTNDLIISDAVRELQVATDGTLQIVTNDANNSAIFKVGENNNERFSEIEFNTVIFDLISKFQNPAITAGVIVEVNPNELKFIVLPNTSNTSVYHGLISGDANKTIIEKSNAGKLLLDSSLASNTFEDLRVTKKGLEYSADYSADFSVRSLVDKGYVDASSKNIANTDLTQTAGQDREYNLNSRQLAFLNSLRLKATGNQSLTQLAQNFTTSVDNAEMQNNSVAPLLDNTTLDLFWKYKNNMGVVSDLFAKVDKSKVYGGARYTLIKSNGTQEYYTTLSQVRLNWVDGDTLHQFADETITYSSFATVDGRNTMFSIPSINWNGNGFRLSLIGTVTNAHDFFCIFNKNVNFYQCIFDFSGTGGTNRNILRVTGTGQAFGYDTHVQASTDIIRFGVNTNANIYGFKSINNTAVGTIIDGAGKAYGCEFANGANAVSGTQIFNCTFLTRGFVLGSALIYKCNFYYGAFALTSNSQARFYSCYIEVTGSPTQIFQNIGGGTEKARMWDCEIRTTTTADVFICNSTGAGAHEIKNCRVYAPSGRIGTFNSASVQIENCYFECSGNAISSTDTGYTKFIKRSYIKSGANVINTGVWDLSDTTLETSNGASYCLPNQPHKLVNLTFIGSNAPVNNNVFATSPDRLLKSIDYLGNVGHGLRSMYPKMTTTERNALTGVEKGYTIENTTTNFLQVYNGSTWKDLLDLT